MSRFFDMDNPVMRALSRLADLMILNLLVFFISLPIITFGAAMTSMHYILFKIARDEEGYLLKPFFKAFRENFKKATIQWLIMLAVGIVVYLDLYMVYSNVLQVNGVFVIALLIVAILIFMGFLYVFPLQCRFENKVGATFRNAFMLMIANLPISVLAAVVYIVPILLFFSSTAAVPIVALFGLSGPSLIFAHFYSKIFKKLEPEEVNPVTDDYSFTIDAAPEEEQIGEEPKE